MTKQEAQKLLEIMRADECSYLNYAWFDCYGKGCPGVHLARLQGRRETEAGYRHAAQDLAKSLGLFWVIFLDVLDGGKEAVMAHVKRFIEQEA